MYLPQCPTCSLLAPFLQPDKNKNPLSSSKNATISHKVQSHCASPGWLTPVYLKNFVCHIMDYLCIPRTNSYFAVFVEPLKGLFLAFISPVWGRQFSGQHSLYLVMLSSQQVASGIAKAKD